MSGRGRCCVVLVLTLIPSAALAGALPTLACGKGVSCVVFANSPMWCWGRNDAGQLGDGTTTDRHTPIFEGDIMHYVAVGDRNVCRASFGDGRMQCTGANEFGQIGDGTTIERHSFTFVNMPPIDLDTFTAGDSPCADGTRVLDAGGAENGVYCWGSNQFGSVGDGTTTDRSSPVLVIPQGSGEVSSGGMGHSCANTSSSAPPTISCWGNDPQGLGPGAVAMSTTPVPITLPDGGPSVLSIGVSHSCMIAPDTTLWCWGLNDHGQLGDGTTVTRDTPVQVPGLTGLFVVSVSSSGGFTCAVGSAGNAESVYCWGRNDRGQLGDGTTTERHVPGLVTTGLPGDGRVSAGENHACAYSWGPPNGNQVACWGGNDYGQVGDGTTTDRHSPVLLTFSQAAPAVPALGGAGSTVLVLALLAAGVITMSVGRARGNRGARPARP